MKNVESQNSSDNGQIEKYNTACTDSYPYYDEDSVRYRFDERK